MAKIDQIDARLFRIPLEEVLSDAKHGDHTHFEVITATVRLTDGRDGTSYSYTSGRRLFDIGDDPGRPETVSRWT
ncbi:MAG: hypothetical protein VXV97_09880 [Pseudomonadota bacterium]|nr:hypothetical protein [Pseudomonadota bacterium]